MSHCWLIFIIILFRLLHIFDSLSKWDFTTFMRMSHKFHAKVFLLPLREPSVKTTLFYSVWTSYSAPVTYFNYFQVDTLLCYFKSLLIHCRNYVVWTVPYFFPFIFHSISRWNFSVLLCVAVTQGSCKISNCIVRFAVSFWVIDDPFS